MSRNSGDDVWNHWSRHLAVRESFSATLTSADLVKLASSSAIEFNLRYANLDSEQQCEAAAYRLRYLITLSHRGEPSVPATLPCVPRKFFTLSCLRLSVSVRATNVLRAGGFSSIGDVCGVGIPGLLTIANCGQKTALEIADAIADAASRFMRATSGLRSPEPLDPEPLPADLEAQDVSAAPTPGTLSNTQEEPEVDVALDAHVGNSLDKCITKTLQILDDKQRHIFIGRFGIAGRIRTLEELGGELNVTRERIRQIEKKTIARVSALFSWPETMAAEINRQIVNRAGPVWLTMLSAQSDFFAGRTMPDFSLAELIQRFSGNQIHCFRIDDLWVASYASEGEYSKIRSRLLDEVREIADSRPTKTQVEIIAESLCASSKCRELTTEVIRGVGAYLHYATPPGESEARLVAFGRGAEQVVKTILEMSDEPLHYLEVARRAVALKGDDYDARRIHNALRQPGVYLLGRGIYGLWRHLDLSEEEISALCDAGENIILSRESHRQWHASEIIEMLPFDVIPSGMEITPHQLSVALSRSQKLTYLNRLVWASADSQYVAAKDRIDIAQACVAILRDAGSPLSRNEILNRLKDWRGVSSYFQIHADGKIIATAPGVFGLRDRDLPVPTGQVSQIMDILATHLAQTSEGIHVSEIDDLIKRYEPSLPIPESTYWIMSESAADDRMRTFVGGYIGVRDWDDPHRLSITGAAAKVAAEAPGSYKIESLCKLVSATCKRPISRSEVVGALREAGFTHDKALDQWTVSASEEEDRDEFDPVKPSLK